MAYHICKVIPDNVGSTYSYLDEEHIVRDGDFVEIPFGNEENIIFGMVIGVGDYEEEDMNEDPEDLFSVIRVISESEYYSTLDEFDEDVPAGEEEITLSLDAALLEELTAICDELGMDIATAFRIFAKKMVREKAIPFDVSVTTYYGEDEDDDDEDEDKGDDADESDGGNSKGRGFRKDTPEIRFV